MSERADLQRRLLELLAGKWVTAAVAAAAELGLADVLHEAPLAPAALAAAVGCDEAALLRLLRVLCSEGLVELDRRGRYALTELGATLRQDQLRELARFVGAPFMWTPWAELAGAVRTGRAAFETSFGASLFEYLDAHPPAAALYHRAVDAFTRRQAEAMIDAYDFSTTQTVVDVGGGLGTLLCELSERWPQLRCVLYDRAKVIEQARAGFANGPLAQRIETLAGDFFERVPEGADAYVVKHVLHNWGDDEAIRLLRNCAQAMQPNGRVLIVESVLLPGNLRDQTRLFDLEMLVLCGAGRERSKPEYRRLLARSGLCLRSSCDLAGTARLLVAARAES
jgi:precorrin-6B methylase 2